MITSVALRTTRAESGFQMRMLARDPVAVLGAASTPLINLPLLYSINRHTRVLVADVLGTRGAAVVDGGTGGVSFGAYLTPALAAFAVAGACMFGLVVRTVTAREEGVLKRVRSTPMSPGAWLAGNVATSVVLALVVVAATFTLGVALYGAAVVPRLLPAALLTVVAGVACFCSLGLALATVIPSRDAAVAAASSVLITLGFTSATFFSPAISPAWMRTTASYLPLEPFTTALFSATNPATPGLGFRGPELARLAVWTVVTAAVALRYFRWEPARPRRR